MLDCIYLYFPVGHDRLQTVLVMSMHQCKDRLIVAYTVSLAWHCIIIILNLIRLCNWVKSAVPHDIVLFSSPHAILNSKFCSDF